jgi:hypothetical protein
VSGPLDRFDRGGETVDRTTEQKGSIMEKRTGTQQPGAGTSRSYVVTGGGRGIGRAVVERLLGEAGTVVAIEFDQAALA